jgi:small-conductance mechanosensitive channel
VFTLVLSVVIAIYVARFIRFTLDEDVFPQLPIVPGAAAAASRLVYYALVLGGILFALTAGGVELSRVTLVMSALGVGIGFGLQNIVNNFVSGLVLAFERPFQIGDIIETGTLTGKVRQIGLRASRVRTLDGAEVIVPNADLIAGNVVNWTLSDRMRRVDIDVGVAYGSEPRRVRSILMQVASDSDKVSSRPEPSALFTGFGDSSLDFKLRVWIPEAGDWPQITSDLNEAVHAALVEADIEIPFPQRTLHIRKDERPV